MGFPVETSGTEVSRSSRKSKSSKSSRRKSSKSKSRRSSSKSPVATATASVFEAMPPTKQSKSRRKSVATLFKRFSMRGGTSHDTDFAGALVKAFAADSENPLFGVGDSDFAWFIVDSPKSSRSSDVFHLPSSIVSQVERGEGWKGMFATSMMCVPRATPASRKYGPPEGTSNLFCLSTSTTTAQRSLPSSTELLVRIDFPEYSRRSHLEQLVVTRAPGLKELCSFRKIDAKLSGAELVKALIKWETKVSKLTDAQQQFMAKGYGLVATPEQTADQVLIDHLVPPMVLLPSDAVAVSTVMSCKLLKGFSTVEEALLNVFSTNQTLEEFQLICEDIGIKADGNLEKVKTRIAKSMQSSYNYRSLYQQIQQGWTKPSASS